MVERHGKAEKLTSWQSGNRKRETERQRERMPGLLILRGVLY
jgi:hypothetical protein